MLTTVLPTTGPGTCQSLKLRNHRLAMNVYYNVGSFDLTPSPLTMAIEQRIAVFMCRPSNSDGIIWLVNEEPLSRANLSNFTTSTKSIDGALTYMLSAGTLLKYNQSSIQCVATFVDGSPSFFAEPVTLLIQGFYPHSFFM